ncbi:hypothetical protein BC332_27912 [Capsicum chinense]|nr:hypothetical protein BC332_27912 [Capsicum chinense]
MQMNVPRYLFGKESLEEIAIFACDCDSQGKRLSSAEHYNSETGTWRTLRSMNKTCKYDLATGIWTEILNLSPVRINLRNGIPATSAAPPLVAVVNNQFTLLAMLKCRLGSMKSITMNGFIEVFVVHSEGPEELNLLGQKQSGSFVYNGSVMGC